MIFLLTLLFGQSMNLNVQPIIVKDEGVQQSNTRAATINCTGAGVTCSQSGTTMTINAAGGGGSSSGTALQAGDGSGGFSEYAGTSCTNQFPRALSASGAATCASVSLTADVSGTLPAGNGGLGGAQPTCGAGQFLTCNGTSCSCSTPAGGSGTSPLILSFGAF